MMKKTFKLASLTFLMFGCAVASEFRPALNLERGPQRYDLVNEKNDKEAWDIDVWSIMYSRNGNKAFGKHGANTNPLSALIFGKSEFKVSDAFAPGMTTGYSEEFNANLNATTLYPRVTYDEKGVNLGASVGYRVMGGKGKLGVKFNVPVKTVRMERDNNAETAEQGNQTNYVLNDLRNARIPINQIGAPGAGNAEAHLYMKDISVTSDLYKLSFIQDLPFVRSGRVAPFVGTVVNALGPNHNDFQAGGQSYATDPGAVPPTVANFGGLAERAAIPYVFLYNPDSRYVPNVAARAVKMPAALNADTKLRAAGAAQANPAAIGAAVAGGAGLFVAGGAGARADAGITPLALQTVVLGSGGTHTTPAAQLGVQGDAAQQFPGLITHYAINGAAAAPHAAAPVSFGPLQVLDGAALPANLQPNTLYAFKGEQSDAEVQAVKDFLALPANRDNVWMMTVAEADGFGKVNAGQNDALKSLIARFGAESAEQWLFRNGYTMQNNQRTGLGDITVNPYYEHSFSAAWNGGVYAHISIPTGGSRKMGDNPYKARLGNDNHFELGAGANVAWQALDWMNVRLDAMAAYALPAKERIAAPFKGATVRALGPTVDADIDYTRIKASLDSTFVHPRTSSLATTIGYDFEFKTKDNVSLKSKDYTFKNLADDANSWFGGTWDNGAGAFRAKTAELDSGVVAKNTENISHQFRMETSWKATSELSLFWGASATPFGQNTMKATTVYGGMSVDF